MDRKANRGSLVKHKEPPISQLGKFPNVAIAPSYSSSGSSSRPSMSTEEVVKHNGKVASNIQQNTDNAH